MNARQRRVHRRTLAKRFPVGAVVQGRYAAYNPPVKQGVVVKNPYPHTQWDHVAVKDPATGFVTLYHPNELRVIDTHAALVSIHNF